MVSKKSKSAAGELSPDEIRRIREGLGLTQVEAGELLGGGPRAFTKYESGTIRPTASVTNLLLLLEKAPQELETLRGGGTVPLDTGIGTRHPLEVSADHIAALTPKKFTIMLERLLAAEALSAGLPMDGIHVAAQLTVGDGGEDARIEWSGGPDRTPFISSRFTQFQLKATSIGPAAAGREVLTRKRDDVKPMVKAALAAGGNYILLVGHPAVRQSMTEHETSIRENLKAKGLSFREDQVAVRDASQIALWANAHPSVAVWVLEQTQPGLIGPFRDWSHWAGRYEHESSPWVDDPRLNPFRAQLRQLISAPRGIARVVGPSGVGKSRLTLEALAPDAAEEKAHLPLSSLVLYAIEFEAGAQSIMSSVQSLVDARARAVVVIDRCDSEMHQDLSGMVRRLGSQVSLVTIDHEYQSEVVPQGTLIIEEAEPAVVQGIIRNVIPAVEKGDQERIARFAGGFPNAARLIAESWGSSQIAATDEALIDRVLLGRRPGDRDKLRQAGMLLSVFGFIGMKPPLDAEIEQVASLPGAPTVDELRGSFLDFVRRGVAQSRGRVLSLQPAPIRLPLAQRQWQKWGHQTWDLVLAGFPAVDLRVRAARQLALLDPRGVAGEVVRSVCRMDGPFGSVERLKLDGAAAVLSLLAEVDAQAVADLLEHVIEPLTASELKEIRDDTRRHLVWALEKIAFREETFEQGARLLLALASAENEEWSNNATAQFASLFAVLGGSTSAGPDARLRVLDEVLSSGDCQRLLVVVEALLEGANTRGGYRTVGAEYHGSRPALSPWLPRYWHEAWDYVRACLARLAKLDARGDTVGGRAKAGLGSKFRELVNRGLLDEVETVFETVVSQSGNYWPEALGSLGDILVYDSSAVPAGDEARIRALISRLTPADVDARVRFLVTEMPWDYPVDEKLDFEERDRRQLADIEALAKELLDTPEHLQRIIPRLSRGGQRKSVAFGRAIAWNASEPLAWLSPIREGFASAPPHEVDAGLLAGFLSGLSLSHPAEVAVFKQEASSSATFAAALPFMCSCIGLVEEDVPWVIKALRAGLVPPERLASWASGGMLARLSPSIVAPLFDTLLNAGGDGFPTALDLMGMYVHGDRARLEELRPQLRLVAERAGKRSKSPPSPMEQHHFEELMKWILAKGRGDSDAAAIALALAKGAVLHGESGRGELLEPLIPLLLRDFPELVWPVLGGAIVRDRKGAWRMELLLGDRFSFEEKRPALLELPEEVLFAWCHSHAEVAPAFVAGLLPILESGESGCQTKALHPRMQRLLDEFGQRSDVLSALTRNLYTFGWSGSPSGYYARYDDPLESLEGHAHGALRRWAKRTRAELRRNIKDTRDQDEERSTSFEI